MIEALKRYSSVVSGFAEVPRKRAEQIASSLAKQGFISTDQVRSIAEEMMRRGRENREKALEFVRRELPKLGVASKTELERLRQRVQALEANQRASARATSPRAPSAKLASSKRSAAPARKRAPRKRSPRKA